MICKFKIAVAFLVVIAGCKGANKDKPVAEAGNAVEIQKIRLRDSNELPVDLEKYKGKTIFINFWATWCKPCIEEMPSIERAQNILRKEEVVFLFASAESAEETRDFRIGHPYKFNYVRIENLEELNIQALPTTFIFNPRGALVFSEMGFRNWDDNNNINMIRKITKKDD